MSNNYKNNMIKKILGLSLAVSVIPATTMASSLYTDFYMDSGISAHRFNVAKKAKGIRANGSKIFKDDDFGFTVSAGRRFGNVGGEIGYTALGSQEYKRIYAIGQDVMTEKLVHSNSNFYVDFNNYFEVADDIEVKTAVGLGVLQTTTDHSVKNGLNHKIVPTRKNSEAELKPRLGAGLQYNLTKTWSANLDLRYQLGNQYYRSMRATALNVTYRM